MNKPTTLSLFLITLIAALALLIVPQSASASACGAGAVLNDAQLTCIAKKAGWRGKDVKTAVRVAKAESGGDSKMDFISRWGGKREHIRGLFAISTKRFDISKSCALNALCNANFAHDVIFKQMGWDAWYGYRG